MLKNKNLIPLSEFPHEKTLPLLSKAIENSPPAEIDLTLIQSCNNGILIRG